MDHSGVEVETKNVMIIDSDPVIVISEDEAEVGIELAIDMAPVAVEAMSIVIDMSILNTGSSL